ncbi:MAG: formate dehydrogenase accessory sulfurtransferase FdhD [Steroidobacteraceae bacterium]
MLVQPEALKLQPVAGAPRLTAASCELTREIQIVDERGGHRPLHIPAEHALTIRLGERELVTLMTLGASPELLVLGYLCNQRLIDAVTEVESIVVDWDANAATVTMRPGARPNAMETTHRIVTTGCGQGSVFGDLMDAIRAIHLPAPSAARISQGTLCSLLETMRRQESQHRSTGSVHGCAVFCGSRMLVFVEDVGRHNALDTIAGWMALHGVPGGDKTLYTTGRMTSEMVMKSAQMGLPIVVSRNGVSAMGYDVASAVGMTLFGRAANGHFLCYVGADRFDAEPNAAPLTATGPRDLKPRTGDN